MQPVIIECAINGVTTKKTNPHVPIEPAEIVEDALACMQAGAAIIHTHIDRVGISVDEAADRYVEAWQPILARRPALANTGGGPFGWVPLMLIMLMLKSRGLFWRTFGGLAAGTPVKNCTAPSSPWATTSAISTASRRRINRGA